MRLLRTSTLWISVPLLVSAGILGVSAWKRASESDTLRIEVEKPRLPADGNSVARLGVYTSEGRAMDLRDVSIEITSGASRAELERRGTEVRLRAGVQPGRVEVEARASGYLPGRASIEMALQPADSDGDGFPDVLLLDPADRLAFRGWFTYMAEAPALWPPERLPAEISDCSALLRFAYREALREHTGEWARQLGLRSLPRSPLVKKYRYPYTLLGANLFRVREGRFAEGDIDDGSFAQFADAQTLQRLNTAFVSRDINQALPGDLLFYRQLEQNQPFHAMVLIGPSHFQPDPGPWVSYHTGPSGESKGEMRRVRLAELLQHPEPRWRPVPGNRNFLGVYRWKILGEME